jgi:uncharacterized protein (DUF433 family)
MRIIVEATEEEGGEYMADCVRAALCKHAFPIVQPPKDEKRAVAPGDILRAVESLERPIEVLHALPSSPKGRRDHRLEFDDTVSEDSPVVKGTLVTASQIVSLVVDGYSWEHILHTHPELCPEDIRACLDYAYTLGDEVHAGK